MTPNDQTRASASTAVTGQAVLQRGTRPERGSTLVEFALVIMVFMTVMLGIIDFSRALYAYHFVDYAAKAATRWAAVNGLSCNADATGSTNSTDPNNPGSCTAPVTYSNGTYSTCTTYGSCLPATKTDIISYVNMLVPMGIDANRITTTVTWPTSGTEPSFCSTYPTSPGCNCWTASTENSPGCNVEVHVSYQFPFLYPLAHRGSIPLSSSSEMVIVH